MKNEDKRSPFEKLMGTMLSTKGVQRVEDIHPEDFLIIMDSIVALFFNQNSSRGKKKGLESLADYDGIKVEYSNSYKYPFLKKDKNENFKIVVLPDIPEAEEYKQFKAREAIKEFACLETIEKYELCLRIFHSFSEKELSILAREFDPHHRDTRNLEERLKQRALKREETN